MTDKTYLQALTEARAAADQARSEAAEKARIASQKIKAAQDLEEERWGKFRAVLNEEAGEFNAARDQTGVFLRGQARPDLQNVRPFACYDMCLDQSATRINITFLQEKDDWSRVQLAHENTRNRDILEICVSDKHIPCNATAVKNLFIELASVMVAI